MTGRLRRHAAPVAVEQRALELAPADEGLVRVDPPPVDQVAVAIAPPVDALRLPLEDPVVEIDDLWLAPPVDVLPVRLAASLFAERTRDVRIAAARVAAMPLVTASIESGATLDAAELVRAHPDRVARMFRRPTPVERLPAEHVRECVSRLYRQSGLSSPAELALVGIFERIPGGAVRSVSQHPRGVVLRLDHRARAQPATLVVGKRRRDGALVTAEVPPYAKP